MKKQKQGKKKPTSADLKNQQKITTFFKKADCSNNVVNLSGPRPRSCSATVSTSGQNAQHANNPVNTENKKEVDLIIISESSSDSDFCPEISEKRLGNENELPLPLMIINPVASDSVNRSFKNTSFQHQQDIKIVDFNQISEAETQGITLNTSEEEPGSHSPLAPLSPSLLSDYTNEDQIVFETDYSLNVFLNTGEQTSENLSTTTFMGPRDDGSLWLSPSKRDASPSSKDAEASKKSIGLFLSPPSKVSGSPRTPTKSPKSVATYFSPVRHLRRPALTSPQRNSGTSPNKKNSPKKLNFSGDPYYYKNFMVVVKSVSSDQHIAYLLNDSDKIIVETFNSLSKQSQCLYIRLFQRKWNFKPMASIKYPLISENLADYFQELYVAGFLEEIKDDKRTLDVVLDLLNGEQMSLLCKNMGASGKTKEVCKASLLKMSLTQKTLFSSSSEIIYKEATKLLGPTYKISVESKNLFSRYFILHAPLQYWEDQSDQSSNQLLSILLMDMGKMEYPLYTISKTLKIYSSRDELISFQDAWGLHSELNAHIESKNWTDVCRIGESCLESLRQQLSDNKASIHSATLPTFLRVYTAGSVLTHTVWLSVQGHQKLKNYSRANEFIHILLAQSLYMTHYRGRWFERAIVNMKHLKTPLTEVMKIIRAALIDRHTLDTHKFMLTIRYEKVIEDYNRKISKIKTTKKSKADNNEETDEGIDIDKHVLPLYYLHHEIPTRTIEGEKLEMYSGRDFGNGPSGYKSVFLGSKSASSVEQFAMNYYMSEGYSFGVHGEGSVPVSIFGLLFWDVVYNDEIPDVFQSVFQPFPLDMNFEEFYSQRLELINERLNCLRYIWSIDDALEFMEQHWNTNYNKICMVNWSLWSSFEDARCLIRSIGLQVTASICERMANNYRHHRSGFPDLVMWNGSKCIFVEVKGPGDSLSAKQSLWIDFLVSIGAQVEVCNVKSVSNKRIRTK